MHAVYDPLHDQNPPTFVGKVPYDMLLEDARRENKLLELNMSRASDDVARAD